MTKQKSFNEHCYEILRKVPKGKVTTYKALARKLNSKAYRAVGNAMNKNPYGALTRMGNSPAPNHLVVPCHRVIKSNGEIGGFAAGTPKKIKLLKSEGVEINDGKVNLKKYLFELK